MGKDIFDNPSEPPRIKIAVIAGASEALKIKSKSFKKSDQEIIQEITKNVEKILDGID
jgi:hypothetical protein